MIAKQTKTVNQLAKQKEKTRTEKGKNSRQCYLIDYIIKIAIKTLCLRNYITLFYL